MIWRARRQWSPGCVDREQSCFFQSLTGLALAFPIVGDNIVWTMSAPVQVGNPSRLLLRTTLRKLGSGDDCARTLRSSRPAACMPCGSCMCGS